MCGNVIAASKSNFHTSNTNALSKKNTGLNSARENRKINIVVFIVFIRCVLQMCSQYTAHSECSTARAVDSFTDTHLQASYHGIPTHRYISVRYYVISAKMCDTWHSRPLHTL